MILKTKLKQLFTSKGRVNRKTYLLNILILIGVIFLIQIPIIILLIFLEEWIIGKEIAYIFVLAIYLPLIPGMVASTLLGIRRLHDLDTSGWIILFQFLPIGNIIVPIFLFFVKGTYGANKYGPDPLAPSQ